MHIKETTTSTMRHTDHGHHHPTGILHLPSRACADHAGEHDAGSGHERGTIKTPPFLHTTPTTPPQPHLPNPLVTASSVDLHNAWVKLQVTSYEMLLKTLMEQHNASPLKEAVVEFAKWQKLGAKQCLDDAEELLKTPEDPNEKELVAEALEMCLTLQNEFQPHLIMCGHLADFDWRMELLEEQYHPMLKTVLSSLTSLCQKIRLGTTVSFKGKAEYESHINDLNDYIAAKDTDTTAWEYAKERTSKIQQLIPRMEAP